MFLHKRKMQFWQPSGKVFAQRKKKNWNSGKKINVPLDIMQYWRHIFYKKAEINYKSFLKNKS